MTDPLTGRVWAPSWVVVPILARMSLDHFLGCNPGPCILELPPISLEAAKEDDRTDKVARASSDGGPDLSRWKEAGMRLLFLGGHALTTIGRSAEADVKIDLSAVSRAHATIRRTSAGGWTLTDLSSANGTFLDGRALAPHESAPLPDSCVLGLGTWQGAFLAPHRLHAFAQERPG